MLYYAGTALRLPNCMACMACGRALNMLGAQYDCVQHMHVGYAWCMGGQADTPQGLSPSGCASFRALGWVHAAVWECTWPCVCVWGGGASGAEGSHLIWLCPPAPPGSWNTASCREQALGAPGSGTDPPSPWIGIASRGSRVEQHPGGPPPPKVGRPEQFQCSLWLCMAPASSAAACRWCRLLACTRPRGARDARSSSGQPARSTQPGTATAARACRAAAERELAMLASAQRDSRGLPSRRGRFIS